MKKILAIRTADRDFGEQLAKSFNKKQDFLFQTFIFSEMEAYVDFAKTNVINVLLCDEELLSSNNEPRNAELVIAFSEVGFASDNANIPSIFKYQASENIMKEILGYYKEYVAPRLAENPTKLTTKKMVCICSPVGGVFSSTFALALASYYSTKGKSLFISFDPFFTLPDIEKDPKERNLTDLISYIDSMFEPSKVIDKKKAAEKVSEYGELCTIKRGNLEVLNGISHWFDICDMKPDRMHYFLEGICNTGHYQYVVFDIGVFGASCMGILLVADRILVPYRDTPLGIRELEEWKRQITFSGNPELLEKTREIIIPVDDGLKGAYGFDDLLKGSVGRFIMNQNI